MYLKLARHTNPLKKTKIATKTVYANNGNVCENYKLPSS